MDYRLKHIYEDIASNNIQKFKKHSLTEAYKQVCLSSVLSEAKKPKFYFQAKAEDLLEVFDKNTPIKVERVNDNNWKSIWQEYGLVDETKIARFDLSDKKPGDTQRRLARIRTAATKAKEANISDEYFYFESSDENPVTLTAVNLIRNVGLAAGRLINQGHAGEAILGAALTCKFIEEPNKNIEYKQIIEILQKILINSKINAGKMKGFPDHYVKFELNLNTVTSGLLKLLCAHLLNENSDGNIKEFQKDDEWAKNNLLSVDNLNNILYLFEVAKNYANGKQAREKIKEALEEQVQGTIAIESIGGGPTQSSTKVDLRIRYTAGSQKPVVKNLLNLSLKAGKVAQFGQVSGGSLATYKKYFESVFGPNLFNSLTPPEIIEAKFVPTTEDSELIKNNPEWFTEPDPNAEDKGIKTKNFGKPLRYLYEQVKAYIQKLDNNALSAALYKGIKYHATLDEKDLDEKDLNIQMLILNPKENSYIEKIPEKKRQNYQNYFQELSFSSSLEAQLKKCTFSVVLQDDNPTTQEIIIKASLDGKPPQQLLKLRSNLSNFRNRIEMGSLLKDIAKMQEETANEIVNKINSSDIPPTNTTQTSTISSNSPEITQENLKKRWKTYFSSL